MSRKTLHVHLILVGLATRALVEKKGSLILEKWVSDKAVSQGMECFNFLVRISFEILFFRRYSYQLLILFPHSQHAIKKIQLRFGPNQENLLKLFENRAHISLKNSGKKQRKMKNEEQAWSLFGMETVHLDICVLFVGSSSVMSSMAICGIIFKTCVFVSPERERKVNLQFNQCVIIGLVKRISS